MGTTIKVDINKAAACNRICSDKAKLFLASTAYKLMFDYVPFDTGTLAESVDIKPEYIHFKQPYAHRCYLGKGMNFRKDSHPLATAFWDKAMLNARKERLQKTMHSYYNHGGL